MRTTDHSLAILGQNLYYYINFKIYQADRPSDRRLCPEFKSQLRHLYGTVTLIDKIMRYKPGFSEKEAAILLSEPSPLIIDV